VGREEGQSKWPRDSFEFYFEGSFLLFGQEKKGGSIVWLRKNSTFTTEGCFRVEGSGRRYMVRLKVVNRKRARESRGRNFRIGSEIKASEMNGLVDCGDGSVSSGRAPLNDKVLLTGKQEEERENKTVKTKFLQKAGKMAMSGTI